MEKTNSKFNKFKAAYNRTLKDCLNLVKLAPHAKVDKLLGT